MPIKTATRTKPKTEPDKEELWELRLYVAGQTARALAAFENLKKICENHIKWKYHIEVIDLLKNPQLARGTRFWPCQHS